jgi:hypothetical protein
MGYNIQISVNIIKETNFFEIERNLKDTAELYNCNSIYVSSEEDGTRKIPRYHCIFEVNFLDENFDNFIKFVKFVKKYRSGYIECIYDNDIYKLIYASSYYLKNIEKDASKNYKKFINDKNFTPNELKLLQEFK